MRKIAVLMFGAVLAVGCNAVANSTVSLTGDEAKKAQSIAERRQQIGFERLSAQNEFQAKINGFAKEEADLNLEAGKLCFAFKKAHKLTPNANYTLDEWNGQLIKQ